MIEAVLDKNNINHEVSRYFEHYEELLLRDFAATARSGVSFPTDYENLENYSLTHLEGEQADVKDLIREKQYVWVQGGAGTGKTILATQCAKEFAAQGKRVLYVCFNKTLASRLRLRGDLYNDNITIAYFNGLPQTLVRMDMNVMGGDGKPDWEKTAEKIGRDLPVKMRLKGVPSFDVLLVDEAQDLRAKQIDVLIRLLRSERKVALFSDPGQNIYRHNEEIWEDDYILARFPGVEIAEPLTKDYRNTDQIYNHFSNLVYLPMKPQLKSNRVYVENKPYLVEPVDESHVDVIKTLRAYLLDGTRKRSDVAVVAFTQQTLDMLPSRIEIKEGERVRLSDNLADWIGNRCVYKSTVHSFKGLEANCLILIDDSDRISDEDSRKLLRYVGESRAKFKLIIAKSL